MLGRYFKFTSNGNSVNTYNHYVEVQIFDTNGTNVALNRGTMWCSNIVGGSGSLVTDGDTSTSKFLDLGPDEQSFIIDIGFITSIAYIKIWRYYNDSRTYKGVLIQASLDNERYETVFSSESDGTYAESSSGKTINMPSGQQYDGKIVPIEGLQSFGRQYINTGVIPTTKTVTEIKYRVQSILDAGPHMLSSANWFTAFPRQLDGNNVFAVYAGGDFTFLNAPSVANAEYVVRTEPGKCVQINGTEYEYTLAAGVRSDTTPLYMFAYGGNPANTYYCATAIVFYCKIWEDGILVRDFIPVQLDIGICGLWDKVESKFYSNVGAGDFASAMKQLYYNGVALPEIPEDLLASYPSAWIRKDVSSGYYDLLLSDAPFYYSSTVKEHTGTVGKPWYRVKIDLAGLVSAWEDNTASNTYSGWTLDNNRTIFWSNHNILNGSATATSAYFTAMQAIPAYILLASQGQSSSNGATSCSLTMNNCTIGNTLILAYVIRGEEPELSDGWIKLGGGNQSIVTSDYVHRLLFAYKTVSTSTETVTITQTSTDRIYMVCSEYSGVSEVRMRNDLASIGTSNYTVIGSKSDANDIMLYGITSNYYRFSGRYQSTTPADLVKIEGDANAERLACWFDGGWGAVEHSFVTFNYTESQQAVLECVQLLYDATPSEPTAPLISSFLIESCGLFYTTADGALIELPITELSASAFAEYGFETLPPQNLLVGLVNPTIYHWTNSGISRPLGAIVYGTPYPQTVESPDYDMTDSTILGIEKVIAVATDSVQFAVSFDSGSSWKTFIDGVWAELSEDSSGMSATTLNSIPTESWNEVATTGKFRFRVSLMDETSEFTSLIVDYLNEAEVPAESNEGVENL